MTLLADIRNLITRRKDPVTVDGADTQAEAPAEEACRINPAEPAHEVGSATVEPANPRISTAAKRPNDAVARLLAEIDDRLGAQTARTHQLMQPMERLPQAMDALTEINRQCTRMLELCSDHLDRAKSREEAIDAAVGRINNASTQHGEVLGVIQQQLDAHRQAIHEAADTLATVSQSLSDVGESSRRSLKALSDLARSSEERQAGLIELLARTQQRLLLVVGLCGAATIVAIITAAVALLNR